MTAPRCLQPPQGKAADAAARIRATIPRIETARLVLRAPEPGDFPTWAEILAAPESRYMGGPTVGAAAWADFCGYVACWLLQGHGAWAVDRRDDAALLGFVHIGLEWDDREPELGYLFAAHARGQGYATEAAAAVRDFGADLLGPGRFVSYVDPGNGPSNRLAMRLGAARDPRAEAELGGQDHVWRHGEPA